MTPINPEKSAEVEGLLERNHTQDSNPELELVQLQALNSVINQHAIVSITDVAGCITFVNDRFCEISGYSRDELLGQNHRIVNSGKYSKEFFHDMWHTIAQGGTWQGLLENRKKDGNPYWVQTTITPICNVKGKPQQYISIRTDVSAREQAKRELQRFKRALDQTLDCVFTFDAETLRFTYVNRGAMEQVGYSKEELLNMTPVDIKPEIDEVYFRQLLTPLLSGEQRSHTFEVIHAHKSGRHIPVEIFLQYLPDDGANQFIAVVRDISERSHMIQALEALSVAEPGDNVFMDIARAVSESLGSRWVGIGRIGADGQTIETIGFWSDGQPGEHFTYALAGTPCAKVLNHVHMCIKDRVAERYPADVMLAEIGAISYRGEPMPDRLGKEIGLLWVIDDKPCQDLATERALLRVAAQRAALEMQRMGSERLLSERNDELYDTLERISDGFFSLDRDWNFTFVNSSAAQIFDSSWYELKGCCIWDVLSEEESFFFTPLQQAINTQKPIHVEGFYPLLDSWLEMHAYPSAIGISVYLQDISEQKKLEQEKREIELRMKRAQKMEALGQLTAGIAHDFNNILSSVMGYTDLALSRCVGEDQSEVQDELTDYLQQVYRASERGRDLVLQMMSFGRGDSDDEATPMDPQPLVKETIKMLQSTLPASITISFERPPQALPAIAISPGQLQQLVMNLCINARDAMSGKGHITLRLGVTSGSEIICNSCYQVEVDDFVELAVSDSGEGIEPHAMEKLFEPFYTSKEVGQGSGLGLSVVHGIIHEHGGHIKVESSPGKGSTFRLFFPAIIAEEQENNVVPGNRSAPAAQRLTGGRILLVDDEQALLGFVEDALKNEGYEVEGYTDSAQALVRFRNDPEHFDLILTDLTMPGITGTELARELRTLRADIPIILCSGYNDGLNPENMPDHVLNSFLPKPYDRAMLLTRIEELLHAPLHHEAER